MAKGIGIKLRKILNPFTGRIVIFPMDHGVTLGVIKGLEDMKKLLQISIDGGADAVVLHKGMIELLEETRGRLPSIFMHLSASTQLGAYGNAKVTVGSVEEAIIRGADGVSCHINLGNEHELDMIKDLGAISSECAKWQIPLLVMIYVRGRYASDFDMDKSLIHAVRLASELGANIVKTSMPSSFETIERMAKATPVPIVIAGGSKVEDPLVFLDNVRKLIDAGARGVAVGRNVFQDENPQVILKAITMVVHKGYSPKEALRRAQEEWKGLSLQ